MSRRLHILFLTQWYPHPEDIQNGIFIKHQAAGLAKQHRVTVLWVGPGEELKKAELHCDNSEDDLLREIRVRYPKGQKAFGKANAWKKALSKAGDPDVVHLQVLDRDFPVWELWLKKVRKPVIIHEHASLYFRGYRKDAIWHASRKRLIADAFRVCPVSNRLEAAMRGKGLHGAYEVVPNILEVPASHAKKPKSEQLRLVSVGDLVNSVKRFNEVIGALRDLSGPWEYTIIGDGPDRKALEQLAAYSFGEDSDRCVRFAGRLEQAEVQKELPKHHICVINSAYETFGLVGLEALNAGVPVLSRRVGVIEDFLVEGRNGFFIEEGDSIAQRISELWRRYEDLDLELLSTEVRLSLSSQAYNDRMHSLYRQLGLFVD